MTDFICTYCYKKIGLNCNCIFCEICNSWIHIKCIKLSLLHFKELSKSDLPYYCHKCIVDELPFTLLPKRDFNCLFNIHQVKNYKFSCITCAKPANTHDTSDLADNFLSSLKLPQYTSIHEFNMNHHLSQQYLLTLEALIKISIKFINLNQT